MQIHHLLELGAEINQRDDKGFTPLHRAAYLAHYEGYLEIYEYLLVNPSPPPPPPNNTSRPLSMPSSPPC